MPTNTKPPTLVVLQLTGGNDALNTVIPYADPLYWDHRPTLRVQEEDILHLDDRFGFNPQMAPLKPFWDAGKLAIINGIGYPNPDYSHFRSMDIWYTAEPEKVVPDGWLGKAVRELDPKAENVLTAVNFGRGMPRALSLAGVPVASVAQLDNYGLFTSLSGTPRRSSALEVFACMYDDGWDDKGLPPMQEPQRDDPIGEVLTYMGRTGLDAQKGADILASATGTYASSVVYPNTAIGNSLKGIAQVKFAGLGTRVFYANHGGFDTHVMQLATHAQLWQEASDAIAAFFADLHEHDEADDVVMFVWSEFGRRVRENGPGTDHGAGGTAFLIGEPVKGGMYGEYPSLRPDDLTLGNLAYNVDLRSAYASILERWLQIDAKPIVNGSFEQLAVV